MIIYLSLFVAPGKFGLRHADLAYTLALKGFTTHDPCHPRDGMNN
jgi:hypothetical protein